ncbi:MAG TPA: tetratricopeptide repeat protein [bacterium]|nr:tetratricopeptide repeat protein [bacterium]
MPQYNRPPKAKAARPDEFISFFDHLTRYFIQHQMKLWVLIGLALLAFGAYTFYQYRIGQKMGALALDYWKADEAPAGETLSAWQRVEKLDPPRPLKDVVGLRLGGAFSSQQNWKDAAAALQDPAAHSFALQSVARLAQAAALENSGEAAKALAVYRSVAENADDPFRFRAKLGMARCYFASGENGEAEKILYALVVKGSDAPEPVQSAAWAQLAAAKVPGKLPESAPESAASR